jgi:hypothetical protein
MLPARTLPRILLLLLVLIGAGTDTILAFGSFAGDREPAYRTAPHAQAFRALAVAVEDDDSNDEAPRAWLPRLDEGVALLGFGSVERSGRDIGQIERPSPEHGCAAPPTGPPAALCKA